MNIATAQRVTHQRGKMQFGVGIGKARRRTTRQGTKQGCKSRKHPGLVQGERQSEPAQSRGTAPGAEPALGATGASLRC